MTAQLRESRPPRVARQRARGAEAARRGLAAALLGLLALASGCGEPVAALDQALARQSLERVLLAWREGLTPSQVRDSEPPIVVGEPRWDQGERLLSFRLLPDESCDGTNLHIPVELELADSSGASRRARVTYVVSTSPALTVFPE